MPSVTLEEAQARLPELIAKLLPGEELFITKDDHTIARLVGAPRRRTKPREPGTAIGKIVILKEDDEHLKDFEDYMP